MQNTQGHGAYRSTDACARCGRGIDPSTAAYTGDGMICSSCEAAESLRQADATAARSSSGMPPIGWGILSLFCNPFFVPSFLAISGGIRDLTSLKLLDRDETPDYGAIQVKSVVAIVLGSFYPFVLVALIGLVLAGAVMGALFRPTYDPTYDSPYGVYDHGYGVYGAPDAYEPGDGYDDHGVGREGDQGGADFGAAP